MAYTSDIERLNYYEGEYLGALDFAAEQEYHREMRRRHNVGQHTWGIVSGLDLAQIPNGQTTGGLAQVDVYVQPGMAVDGFGREIVLLSRTQLTQDLFAAFYDPNTNANPRNMYIWIAYDQQLAKLSGDACTRQNTSNPYGRLQESFRLLATSTPTPVPALNDSLIIDGTAMTPPVEPAAPPSPAPTPTPGEIDLPYDGSVPYQEFAQDDTTAHWYVLIGQVLWHPHFQVLLQTAAAASGRQYCGAVAAAIEAPNASLVIQDRMTPSPLPADPTYSGVSVEVQGALTVDRLLAAMQDLWIHEHGHLNFKQSDGTDGDTPLWIRRFTNPTGGADLHIHIGDTTDPSKRLTVGYGADEANQQIVFVIVNGSVGIGTATPVSKLQIAGDVTLEKMSGSSPRALPANGTILWNDGTWLRLNQNLDFSKPIFGVHTPGLFAPGSLNVGGGANWADPGPGNVWVTGNVGIGTQAPARKLHVVGDRIRLESGGKYVDLRTDGSAVDLQSETSNLYLRSSGPGGNNSLILNPFLGDGNVGIGTQAPAFKLDIAGFAHASGFPTSSDDRFKRAIVPIEGVLEKLRTIRGVSFEWNEKYTALGRSTGRREIGVLAHEVAAVFPELVTKWGDENYLAVDYGRMTAVLVEAIKELIEQNEALSKRLDALKKRRSISRKKTKE
jgi:hypothetical protein